MPKCRCFAIEDQTAKMTNSGVKLAALLLVAFQSASDGRAETPSEPQATVRTGALPQLPYVHDRIGLAQISARRIPESERVADLARRDFVWGGVPGLHGFQTKYIPFNRAGKSNVPEDMTFFAEK